MPASAAAELEVLWDDGSPDPLISISSGFTGSDADRTFTVEALHASNQGNAVVAIKDIATGTIRWSWHLWVTDSPTVNTWTNNGYIVMDRYLGATTTGLTSNAANGLLYQWGRKDPIPDYLRDQEVNSVLHLFHGIDIAGDPTKYSLLTLEATPHGAQMGIMESIRNPLTFFSGPDNDYGDWLPYGVDTLWNAAGDNKTIYDPCPFGWRVPYRKNGKQGPLDGCPNKSWIKTDAEVGADLGTHAKFRFTDIIGGKGNYRHYWSGIWIPTAIPYDPKTYVRYLDENSGSIHGIYHAGKSNATPVRCVKE
jgi:hypothetical protein